MNEIPKEKLVRWLYSRIDENSRHAKLLAGQACDLAVFGSKTYERYLNRSFVASDKNDALHGMLKELGYGV
jgi:hypothetical protein